MYQFNNIDDTIAAISTALGQGGIGIVRLSGKKSLSIVDQIFKSHDGTKPSSFRTYTVHHGWMIDPKDHRIIDEVLLTLMRRPRSYTKEDVVEISCHGGIVSLQTILNIILSLGVRLAEPGEFTKRAFLNGRIDLAQAEAVLDIIQSKTDTFLRVSTNQLKGDLSTELESIREDLMKIYVEMEAIVNFPEDEINAKTRDKLWDDVSASKVRVGKLLLSADQGRLLKEGIKIVLCGRPNVGKSSLLNLLLRQPRAIVSEIAGTTRDTIEESAQIKGIPFQLVDTAGILDPRDKIEEEAIKRSQMSIASADLVLLILDGSQSLTNEDKQLIAKLKDENTIFVFNKKDLGQAINIKTIGDKLDEDRAISISAITKDGLDQLQDLIVRRVGFTQSNNAQEILVSNLRHITALKNALAALDRSQMLLHDNISFEFVSEEIKTAVNFLDSITGRNIDADLLDTIFSQFCIGK